MKKLLLVLFLIAAQLSAQVTPGYTVQPVSRGGTGASTYPQNINNIGVSNTTNPRAARQGLVFDGSSAAAGSVSIAAFGTANFSLAAVALWKDGTWANYYPVFGNTANSNNPFFGSKTGTGELGIILTGGSWLGSGYLLTAGKETSVAYTKSGTTGTFYVNGVSVGTVTDNNNYSVGINQIGGNANSTSNALIGTILGAWVYNRALSASDVLALYEQGTPGAADYPSIGAGQSLLNATGWTINAGSPTIVSASAVTLTAGSYQRVQSVPTFTYAPGNRVRVSGSIAGYSGGDGVYIYFPSGTVTPGIITANGAFSVEIVSTSASASFQVLIENGTATHGNTSATITGLAVTFEGLLLAPGDQSGGGPSANGTWYDESGNAANITLPASGVTWNRPNTVISTTTLKTSGNGTIGGNLTVSGTQGITLSNSVNLAPSGTGGVGLTLNGANQSVTFTGGNINFVLSDGNGHTTNFQNTGTHQYVQTQSSTTDLRLGTNGADALIIDSSQKATFVGNLTVSGTQASSSTTTGSGVFGGGIGVAGAGYFGGILSIAANQQLKWGSQNAMVGDGTTLYLYAGGTGGYVFRNHGDSASSATLSEAGAFSAASSILSSSASGGIGYTTGAGGTITQTASRTNGVTLNTVTGAITLVSAAGTASWQSFTVTDSAVAATDVVRVCQKSGTDLYQIHVTNVAAGSFKITYATTGGTTTEQPVFNFAVIKGSAN